MARKRTNRNKAILCSLGFASVALILLGILLVRGISHQQTASPVPARSEASLTGLESDLTRLIEPSVTAKPQTVVLMGPSSAEKAMLSLDYLSKRDVSDGRQFVSFDISAASNMHMGDTFALQIPGEADTSIAMVNDIEGLDGIRRLTGTVLNADSSESRFSLTISDDGTYVAGHFALSGREYIVEAKNGSGWLMDASQMTERLIQSENDTNH